MRFKTINPATEELIAEYETMDQDMVSFTASRCSDAYLDWRKFDISERISYVGRLASVLRKNSEAYAGLITLEMGKPVREAIAEVEKCAWLADVYADKSEEWLRDETVEADGRSHAVTFEPLGLILSIMPWNFPFWQALRFAVPTLIAGNVSILKHSNQVPECALAIEGAFREAGFPEGVFRTIIADHETVEELIASDIVRGVSLTGSTDVGRKIAGLAGQHLKKVVLELGGSDPFIVLEDADLEFAAKNAVLGRTLNAGQSCIAAKRFIVLESVVDEFSELFAGEMERLKVGDPMLEKTDVGPLVSEEALLQIEEQVKDAVSKGAKLLAGGERLGGKGFFFRPTILTNTTPDMKVVKEEVFGPVAPVIVVRDEEEAVGIANDSEFGLGGCVWTRDLERGERLARRIESGSVFVNCITKSDPRMPFGGIKNSGIGRELSRYGLREFVNVKGISVYEHV